MRLRLALTFWSAMAAMLVLLAACGMALAANKGGERPTTAPASALRFLTGDPSVTDYAPCVSPDGQTVLFTRSADRGRTWALYTVPSAGGEARRLTPAELPVSATRPNWSVDGRTIAFTGITGKGGGSLWLIDANGSNPRRVEADGLSSTGAFYPSWFPAGDRLVVVDYASAGAGGGTLKVVDLRQRKATPLTDARHVLAGMPTVSPDGSAVVFAGQSNDGQRYDQTTNRIWVVSENDGATRVLVAHEGRAPSWSPDGRRVAYESLEGSTGGRYAAFVVDRDGGNDRALTDHAFDANHPKWTPDGRQIVLSARPTPQAPTAIAIMAVP